MLTRMVQALLVLMLISTGSLSWAERADGQDGSPASARGNPNSDASCRYLLSLNVNRASQRSGKAVAQRGHHGDILIAVGEYDGKNDHESGAEVLFRIAPLNTPDEVIDEFLARLDTAQDPVTITELSSPAFYELLVQAGSSAQHTWAFRVNKSGCDLGGVDSSAEAGTIVVNASGVARHDMDPGVRSLDDAISQFMNRSLVERERKPVSSSSSEADTQALYCLAGGPGAVSCSWQPGTIGPIGGGGCQIECSMPQYQYACCGPGVPYCECKSYDDDSGGGFPPLPPPIPDPCDADPDNCGEDDPHGG
ncbi:hypothetical protein [Wenzhouxiangella sp. EGI_FJ10409]|uniref:hypothetical protein n=1 Tax=Wenzhouxiangella sp. EGI_FJ10409 TaxID=3243767 RepID=UPI0035DAD61F